jgi:predicted dehydrogenase
VGKLNVARYIHTDFYTPRMAPGVELPQPFFRTMPKLLFYEMGVHWYDTWRFLFGTPQRLYSETTRVSPHVIGEDSGIVVLGYDDFYGFLDMSWATRQKLGSEVTEEVGPEHLEQMIIEGEKGTLKLYHNGKITLVDNTGREEILVKSTEYDHEESHFRLQSHFIQCLDNREEFQTSGKDNLVTLKMAFGTYESSNEHKPIFFE